MVVLRVSHRGYVARACWPVGLAWLLEVQRAQQDQNFFERITLAKGLEYSGRIVTPEGEPAAGLEFAFTLWTQDNHHRPQNFLHDDTKCKTDRDGFFRLRMPRVQQLAISASPPDHALFQRFWGVDEPNQDADLWVPSDLGRLVLSKGMRLTGRLFDFKGRPVAGQSIVVTAQNDFDGNRKRAATTDEGGRFTFAPLSPGNYIVHALGHNAFGNVDNTSRLIGRSGTCFEPVKAYLKDGIVPQPLILREGETVTVECRCVDSREHPVRGNHVFIQGTLPLPKRLPALFAPPAELLEEPARNGISALINGPQTEDRNPLPRTWATQLLPDDQGRVGFLVPRGLLNAVIWTNQPDETVTIKSRAAPGQPLRGVANVPFRELTTDVRGVTFIHYRAPTVVVSIRNEDGDAPFLNVRVQAADSAQGNENAVQFTEQPDGRFLSPGLLPGEEYHITAWAAGLVPLLPRRLKLAEGERAALCLTLRRQPKAPERGEAAREFWVKTLGGHVLSSADFRGRFVMIHFWSPSVQNGLVDLPNYKKVYERFGVDRRFAMLGFSVTLDRTEAEKAVQDQGLSWPQVALSDAWADSIALDYHVENVPQTFLIGPDGVIIAMDISGDQIVEAVEKALGAGR
jgi:hypothetical protein